MKPKRAIAAFGVENRRLGRYPAAMEHRFIYHMCRKPAWHEALETGEYRGSALDLKDGFIHFSTAEQVQKTAALHLTRIDDLVLLRVPVDAVADALKWEASRDGALFPHLYRSLRCDEPANVTDLELDASGRHVFPRLA